MNVVIYSLTEEEQISRFGNAMSIEINGVTEFTVYDGEPEDNNLNRNFNDCLSIDNLIELAYKAGKNGEELSIQYREVDSI